MARRRTLLIGLTLAVLVGVAAAWLLVSRFGSAPPQAPADTVRSATPVSTGPERKITATMYFISEDGMALVGVQREVPFGEPIAEQARLLVEAQLENAPEPLARAVPAGTTLRGLYLTDAGDAFVDLSDEARTRHTGGALNELFTIYAIVDALTVNLPSVRRVQILVNGREVDTLAGHVDLRHPLEKNLTWVRTEKDE